MEKSNLIKNPNIEPKGKRLPLIQFVQESGFSSVDLDEKKRVYHYASGSQLILNNATELSIHGSEHHIRADGKLWIIPAGWIVLEIEERVK